MLIEPAINEIVEYKAKRSNLVFYPGQPVSVPNELGQKIIHECAGRVRRVTPDWLTAWRELAQVTLGITDEDERFSHITQLLSECDKCFEQDDWSTFQENIATIESILTKP